MSNMLIMAEIAGRHCAFRASEVDTIVEIENITPIPRAPKFLVGLTALRSRALTVFDCRLIIDKNSTDHKTDSRAVVILSEGHSYALLVDEVRDVGEMLSEPTQIPGGFGKVWSRIAEGIVETDNGPALLLAASQLVETKHSSLRAA